MEKTVNQIKWGAIISYAQMALNIVIGLIYTPIMLKLLGKSEYGLYNTVSSTISMLSILNLGFNSGYIRYYAKYKKENCETDIYKLNGLFLIIFTIIGIVGLFCGLFLSFNLELVFKEGLTISEYKTAKILMLLLTVNLAVSFPMGVFSNIISAHEKYIFLKLLGILKTVISPLVTLPLLLMGYRSVSMVLVTLIVSIVTDLLYLLYVKKALRQRFIFKEFEKGIFKSLFAYTSFIAINLIVDQINWNIDKFLLGRFKGTGAVAVYSVGYMLYQYYMTLSTSVSNVFTPRIHRIINQTAEDERQQTIQLTSLFVKVGRIQFLILSLIATGMIFFGKPFIYFWAGEGYEEAYYVMLLLVLSSSIALIQNCGIEIQRAENKHQFRSILYSGMAIVNLVLSIFLCQKYGAVGSAIGTAISLILANGIIMNIYYHKRCRLDIVVFWRNIVKMSFGLIPPVILGIILSNVMNLYTVYGLLAGIAIYCIIFCISVWLLSMNAYEKEMITNLFKKLVKKHAKR